jgi:hypothetical protein
MRKEPEPGMALLLAVDLYYFGGADLGLFYIK